MNLTDYREGVARTLNRLGDIKLDLCHVYLGILSELKELGDAEMNDDLINQKEEWGDIAFYTAGLDIILGLNIQEEDITIDNMTEEQRATLKETHVEAMLDIADVIKKHIAYNKLPLEGVYKTFAVNMFKAIQIMCKEDGIDFRDALQVNIDKLQVRYPEKFTEELATNRDLEAERKILEGR